MKKLTLIATLLFFFIHIQAQTVQFIDAKTNCPVPSFKKTQNTGWTLFGVGLAIASTGYLITEIDGTGQGAILSENFDIGAWMFFGGLICSASSIPVFIHAKNLRKKEIKMAIKIRTGSTKNPFAKNRNIQPTLSLQLQIP